MSDYTNVICILLTPPKCYCTAQKKSSAQTIFSQNGIRTGKIERIHIRVPNTFETSECQLFMFNILPQSPCLAVCILIIRSSRFIRKLLTILDGTHFRTPLLGTNVGQIVSRVIFFQQATSILVIVQPILIISRSSHGFILLLIARDFEAPPRSSLHDRGDEPVLGFRRELKLAIVDGGFDCPFLTSRTAVVVGKAQRSHVLRSEVVVRAAQNAEIALVDQLRTKIWIREGNSQKFNLYVIHSTSINGICISRKLKKKRVLYLINIQDVI